MKKDTPFMSNRRTWRQKCTDAFRGVIRAVQTQSSCRVHLVGAVVVIGFALGCGLTHVEWCVLVGAIGSVLAAETFNTAIESLARVVHRGEHPDIRDALDMASGTVLIVAVSAAVIGGIIFGNRIGMLLEVW